MLHSPIVKAGPGSVELPRSPSPIVKANDLLFVHFERPDLRKVEQYLGARGAALQLRDDVAGCGAGRRYPSERRRKGNSCPWRSRRLGNAGLADAIEQPRRRLGGAP